MGKRQFKRTALALFIFFPAVVCAQSPEQGIPVTDPLVIAKCGSCHPSDDHGNMRRISWERTTPEGWQDALKEMIVLNRVSVTPAEARAIVKYLSASHGLAPQEAEPVMYDPERRFQEETLIPTESLRQGCSKCHSFARALTWRRSAEDWKQFGETHAARYNARAVAEAVSFLSKAAPLHTPAWDGWQSRTTSEDLAGRWLVRASMPGHGSYYGDMQIARAGDGEYTTRVSLTSIRDDSRLVRAGRVSVFGAYAWRGRSEGTKAERSGSGPDGPSSEAREVLLMAPDQLSAKGRWFWGQYQEFGFDVQLQRASAAPALLGVDPRALKAGTQTARVRLFGDNFPAEIAPGDLDLGPGIRVRRIVSHTPGEIAAELEVAADAQPGKRDARVGRSSLTDAIAIYDRIDYIQVTPESAMAAFSDPTHPKGYQQFEAIGYQRGADGRLHTADDVPLGPVDVEWSFQIFHAAEGAPVSIGTVSSSGLFIPSDTNPNANFDVWVTATARGDKDRNGAPLVGKSYLVLTVPTYTFNGRRYVRDLDRWVDEGPAAEGH